MNKDRETICGDRGQRISYRDPQLYQKMCCSLFSHASPSLSLFLSFSLYLFLSPLSWPFNSLKRYCEGEDRGSRDGRREGGLFYPLLSVSLVPVEQKQQLYLPVCVCVCVCVYCWLMVAQDINNYAHLFISDSAVNNLNSFPFGNR